MATKAGPRRADTNWLRTEILSEFSKLLEVMSSKMKETENNRNSLLESYETVKRQIGSVKNEFMADLQRLHDETISVADTLKEKAEQRIDKYRGYLELKNKSITSSVDRISRNKSTFSAPKEMEYLKIAQNEVTNIDELEQCTLSFKRSNTLASFLRQMYNYGSVNEVKALRDGGMASRTDGSSKMLLVDDDAQSSELDVISNIPPQTLQPLTPAIQPSLRDYDITNFPLNQTSSSYRTLTWEGKFRLDLSDKHKATDACCLNGIAVLNNKVIAVCDSPHDCIQFFNGNYELLEELECKRPRGICTIASDTFAVSMYGEPMIRLLSVAQPNFAWTNDIKISCKSWIRDIKQIGKSLYLLCDDGDIHRTNLKGKTELVLPTGLGKHQCRYLCVKKDSTKFFISGEDAVICLTRDGKQIWKYCDAEAKTEGRGLALFDNHVFISDWKNSSLIELSEDGKVMNVTKDIGYPYALNIVEGERFGKVFVTQFSRFVSRDTRRCIHVYRMGKHK